MPKNKNSKSGKNQNGKKTFPGNTPGGQPRFHVVQNTGQAPGQKRRFDEKNKKKKTFLGRCKRLLSNMLELDDSKPFRAPVDKLKYPDYHTVVRYDIDLVRIGTKLAMGQYPDPLDFGRDVRLMISNWKEYIKDPSLPIYSQISRLSWWFEAEFSKITSAYEDHKSKKRRVDEENSTNDCQGSSVSTSALPTPPHLLSSVVANGRLRIMRAPGTVGNQARNQPNTNMQDLRNKIRNNLDAVVRRPPQSSQGNVAANNVGHPPHTNANVNSVVAATREAVASSIRGLGPQSTSTAVCRPVSSITTTANTSQGAVHITGTAMLQNINGDLQSNTRVPMLGNMANRANNARINIPADRTNIANARTNSLVPRGNAQQRVGSASPRGTAASPRRNSASPHHSSSSPANAPVQTQAKVPEIELMFSAPHVWFGEFKNKPPKELRFTEKTLEFPIKTITNEAVFQVQAHDIIRCCGHFGNLGKLQNTLFVFLSPAATKRLKACMKDLGVTAEVCSLIVIFGQDLTTERISKLIHIFWVMGRQSIFGSLFSEVDKKGALAILANIKPQILQKLTLGAQNANSNGSCSPRELSSPALASPGLQASRCVPNLNAARQRKNSATEVSITSSTNPDHPEFERRVGNDAMNNRNNMNHAIAAHQRDPHNRARGYTFQRSRLPINPDCQNAAAFQNTHEPQSFFGQEPANSPSLFDCQPRVEQYRNNRFGQRDSDPGMHRNQLIPGPSRFQGPVRNFDNQNSNEPFQEHNQGMFNVNSEIDRTFGLIPTMNVAPWRQHQERPYQPQYINIMDNYVSCDFTEDVDLDTFHSQNQERNTFHPQEQEDRHRESVEGQQPAGVSSTEDQTGTHNSSVEGNILEESDSSLRTVELVNNTENNDASPGRILIRFSHDPTGENQNETSPHEVGTSAQEETSAQQEANEQTTDRSADAVVESNVSSTDQTLNDDVTETPQGSQPEQQYIDVDPEPVSSSAPVDIVEVENSEETETSAENNEEAEASAENNETTQLTSAAVDCHPESEQLEQEGEATDEDDDLEIIIPSDTDEELSYIPPRPEKAEEGEDLVMMARRISTKCPVTQQVMRRPVKNRHCGHCYDRDGIQQIVINRKVKARCPVPGCSNPNALLMEDMEFDTELFNYIRTHSNDPELQKELNVIHKEMSE